MILIIFLQKKPLVKSLYVKRDWKIWTHQFLLDAGDESLLGNNMIIWKEGNILVISKDADILSGILLMVYEHEITFCVHLFLDQTLPLHSSALFVILQSLLLLTELALIN